ncbi:MAG: hypothetical protein MRY79_01030 [Alphaproteobacteria bacterium]|nr:hypothetical protein [Alphaproteobacteria bacterium]
MPLTVQEFQKIDNKVVTLMGMSGLGKTYLSNILARSGWLHYSCDVEIAGKMGISVETQDLSALSDYIGQVGDEAQGGLPLEEFKKRQKQYYEAECAVLSELTNVIGNANLVNDSTGSFCEITDEDLIQKIADQSLIIYIQANEQEEREILKRATEYPKPLYYPADMLDEWLENYMTEQNLADIDDIAPNDFARWVFPKLFRTRLPKYEHIANKYGVTIPSDKLRNVKNADEFLGVVERHLS